MDADTRLLGASVRGIHLSRRVRGVLQQEGPGFKAGGLAAHKNTCVLDQRSDHLHWIPLLGHPSGSGGHLHWDMDGLFLSSQRALACGDVL